MRRQNPLSSLGRNCVEKSAGKSQLLHCLFAAAIHPTKNAHHKPRTGLGASNRLEFLETRWTWWKLHPSLSSVCLCRERWGKSSTFGLIDRGATVSTPKRSSTMHDLRRFPLQHKPCVMHAFPHHHTDIKEWCIIWRERTRYVSAFIVVHHVGLVRVASGGPRKRSKRKDSSVGRRQCWWIRRRRAHALVHVAMSLGGDFKHGVGATQ